MGDKEAEAVYKSRKDLIIKITVPIILICLLIGIWAIKNSQKNSVANPNDINLSSATGKSESYNNIDFALHVTEKLDIEKLKSYGLPIIIDFGADSCIPCKEMAPVLKELNEELRGKAIIKFVDIWKYQSFAEGYPISVIPTQIFIDADGKPYEPKDPDALQFKLFSNKNTNEHTFTAHQGGLTKEKLIDSLIEMGMK